MVISPTNSNQTLILDGLHDEVITFDSPIVSDSPDGEIQPGQVSHKWPRTRCHVLLKNSKNITIEGLKVIGPNSNGGTGSAAYVGALEAQHAIWVADCENITIDGLDASYIYGDGIYLRRVNNCVIKNSLIHHNGRQGIAIIDSSNVIVYNNHLHDIRRSHIDLENNSDKEMQRNIVIDDNLFGRSRLGWIANGGRGRTEDVIISNNTLDKDDFMVTMGRGPLTKNVTIINNKSNQFRGNPQGTIMRFFNVDGLFVHGNVAPGQPYRNMYLMGCKEGSTKNVVLGDNQVAGVINWNGAYNNAPSEGYNEIKWF